MFIVVAVSQNSANLQVFLHPPPPCIGETMDNYVLLLIIGVSVILFLEQCFTLLIKEDGKTLLFW